MNTQENIIINEEATALASGAPMNATEIAEKRNNLRSRIAAAIAVGAIGGGAAAAGVVAVVNDDDDEALDVNLIAEDNENTDAAEKHETVREEHVIERRVVVDRPQQQNHVAQRGNADAPQPATNTPGTTSDNGDNGNTGAEGHQTQPHVERDPDAIDPNKVSDDILEAHEIDSTDLEGTDLLEEQGLTPVEVGTINVEGTDMTVVRLVNESGNEYCFVDSNGDGQIDGVLYPNGQMEAFDGYGYTVNDLAARVQDGGFGGDGYLDPLPNVVADNPMVDIIDPNRPDATMDDDLLASYSPVTELSIEDDTTLSDDELVSQVVPNDSASYLGSESGATYFSTDADVVAVDETDIVDVDALADVSPIDDDYTADNDLTADNDITVDNDIVTDDDYAADDDFASVDTTVDDFDPTVDTSLDLNAGNDIMASEDLGGGENFSADDFIA